MNSIVFEVNWVNGVFVEGGLLGGAVILCACCVPKILRVLWPKSKLSLVVATLI